MSRKRKLSNRKNSIKPKSPLESIGVGEVTPMTIRDCAVKLAGEEMRSLLVELIYSQVQMFEYLGSTGLSAEPYLQLYQELLELGIALTRASNESLDYLRTFIIDGVDLEGAIEMAMNFTNHDLSTQMEKC